MLAQLGVEIDFANGASFSYPLLLGDISFGILGTNVLADNPSDVVDVTDQVMRVSTRRGRNRILTNFEAGTATVTLNDPNSDFSPTNPASPYFGKLLPLRKIRIFAEGTVSGNPYRVFIFSGYITSYDTNFYQGVDSTSTVTLQCVDGFRLLNNVSTGIAPVPFCVDDQFSGARVHQLLSFAGFPSSMEDLDQGTSTMQADPGGARSVLAAIQTVEQSEFGAFYMSRQGEAKFLSRDTVTELADSQTRYYADSGDPGSQTYTNLDFAFDDQLILNDVTVTAYPNVGLGTGTPQESVDAASIVKYFTKSGQRSDILVRTDQEALDQARTLIAARKDAILRIDAMDLSISGETDEANLFTNLSTDIYDLVFITKAMPGGSTVAKELFIQGVENNITPNNWTMRLLTAEPLIQAFILDSGTQGLLSINALSY
jgi:hypothetical protein